MATIKLNDDFGFDIDASLADSSALLQYAKDLPALLVKGPRLSEIKGLTLDQPAVKSLQTGLSFARPVTLGDQAQLTIQAGVHGSFGIVTTDHLFSPDPFGENIAIPAGSCYVSTQLEANAGAAVAGGAGDLQFGCDAGSTLQFANYRRVAAAGTTLIDALAQNIGGFLIPATPEALDKLPVNGVATVTGTASLKLSVTANLLAATNPLATLTLPSPAPAVKLSAGGSVQVGASFTIAGEYQIRAEKLASGRVRLGWYRRHSEAVAVSATLSEGLAANIGSTDLLTLVVKAISGDPQADEAELKNAGLNPAQIRNMQSAVQAAVQRKLEVALSAEIGALRAGQAAFLYEIDLGALTAKSRAAIAAALAGNLTPLHDSQDGVHPVRSIWTDMRQSSLTFKVNLLGIYNFLSITKLTTQGVVLYEPSTGALVITDSSTAERIRSSQVNFDANPDKLRALLAESFLITAAYHGSQSLIGAPSLECTHSFFTLKDDPDSAAMGNLAHSGVALGLVSEQDAAPPAAIGRFGRTTLNIEAVYNQALASSLFSSTNPADYEQIGRRAVLLLVREGDEDAERRIPAGNDEIWKRMRETGSAPGIEALFPGLPEPRRGAIVADYVTIVWWAEAMAGAAARLHDMRQFLSSHPGASSADPEFQKRRAELASHLKSVAADTREEFGQPWGLVAMNELAGRQAVLTFLLVNAKFALARNRPADAAAAGSSGV